jgi:asparagine synthetase B (glutamine-hydrolysing)
MADRLLSNAWPAMGQFGGPLYRYERGRGILIWTEDGFTRFETTATGCTCEMLRPGIDPEAVSKLTWDVDEGITTVERLWSGEFRTYYVSRPEWIISSHLWAIAASCQGVPPNIKKLQAGWSLKIDRKGSHALESVRLAPLFPSPIENYRRKVETVKELVLESVGRAVEPAALLLSGGLDSSIVAAAAAKHRKNIQTFVFGLRRKIRPQRQWENDFDNAERVARHLGLTCERIFMNPRKLRANVPLAVALAETPRGTIIDDCVALIEVAKHFRSRGFSVVWTGDGADDLFGGFKFVLNYYRGKELRQYFRRSLDVALPDELAVIQRIFEPWGISVIHPFWTAELKAIGRSLPLEHRVDRHRLMKRILRDAFSDSLPEEIWRRPKGSTRDTTQVRWVLEREFGSSRERYRPVFHEIFRSEFKWPRSGKEVVTKKSRR